MQDATALKLTSTFDAERSDSYGLEFAKYNQTPEVTETAVRLIHVEHAAGSFLVRTAVGCDDAAAIEHTFRVATERWDLDIATVDIATQEDIAEADGQITDLEADV